MRCFYLVLLLLACMPEAARSSEDSLRVGRFGTVHLYATTPQPSHVVLFVSGDGGWNQGVVDMARELAGMDALVAGIDITHYLKELAAGSEVCYYPAAEFEDLSKAVQMHAGMPHYVRPTLVGYSSGATLVYAILVQAPPTTFRGGISLGFCPDLDLNKPLCKGSGLESTKGPKGKGLVFLPAHTLAVPWVALQGTVDQVCSPPETEHFVQQVPGAQIVVLPKVGHGYSVPRNWMPQFKAAFTRIAQTPDSTAAPAPIESLKDLPLTELPATATGSNTLAVWLTGDGGYGVTDQGVTHSLAAHGIPVVVWNALHYFWTRRTPDGAAADLERILRAYMARWSKDQIVLVGYSRGADTLPFMLNRLPAELRDRTRVLVLLGPSPQADFQFHLSDWLGGHARSTSLPVLPELEKLRGKRMLCFYGTKDADNLCEGIDKTLVEVFPITSGHRFGGNYESIAAEVLKAVQ